MREIQIGRIYRHFKGNFYLAEAVAKDADSGEDCVIYRKLYGDGGLWVRPLEEFLSPVDREKYPDAPQEFRFELQEVPGGAETEKIEKAFSGWAPCRVSGGGSLSGGIRGCRRLSSGGLLPEGGR